MLISRVDVNSADLSISSEYDFNNATYDLDRPAIELRHDKVIDGVKNVDWYLAKKSSLLSGSVFQRLQEEWS